MPRIVVLVLAMSAALVWTATSHADTYEVQSCGDATVDGADDAWTFETTNEEAYQPVGPTCPPAAFDRPSDGEDPAASTITGLAAWTRLDTAVKAWPRDGQYMQYALHAPEGTTIRAITITRSAGKDDQQYEVYGRADGVLISPNETCEIDVVGGYFTCDTGGGAYTGTTVEPRLRIPVTYTGLNASELAWGVECPGSGCGTGAAWLHSAWVAIYASTTTIDDPTPPSAAALSIPGSGWRRGTVGATGSGSDSTGIRGFRWYADGAAVGPEVPRAGACDYTRVAPCSEPADEPVTLDTTALADGTRSVELAVVDAGGNERRSAPVAIQVDNTPPAAPAGLSATGGGGSPAFALAWTDPPADGGSPLEAIRWRACAAGGAPCASGSTPAAGGTQALEGLTLPGAGTYEVAVWAVDAAGNAGAAATTSITYTAPPSGGGGGGPGGGGSGGPAGRDATIGGSGGTLDGDAWRGNDGGGGEVGLAPSAPVAPAAGPPAARTPVAVTTATISPRTGRLLVRGRVGHGARGRVVVAYRVRLGGRTRTRSTTAPVVGGRFTARIALPRAWRSARGRVEVRYTGAGGAGTGRASVRVGR